MGISGGLKNENSSTIKQSTYPKRRTAAVKLAVAVMVNQPQIREVIFAPTFLGHHMMDVVPFAIFQRSSCKLRQFS
jgi:hypothetical protein